MTEQNADPSLIFDYVDWTIGIVCTDRGQHKRTRLTTAGERYYKDGRPEMFMSHALRNFAPPMADAEDGTRISRHSYVFRCPLCGRMPTIHRDRWWAGVRRAHEAGLAEIDLSVIGF